MSHYIRTITIHVDVNDLVQPGQTVKIAYEKNSSGFVLGVILPNGDPWVFHDHSETEEELQAALADSFQGRIIEYMSIEEYNTQKEQYTLKRHGRI